MRYFRKQCVLMVILFLASIWGVNTSAWGQQAEETGALEVIGRGVIYHDNVAKARDEAIADGLRNAVEQCVGLLISSQSVVSHFQVLSDRVYSQAEEFILDYKVLTESKSGRNYRLVVRATLLTSVLQDKLCDIGILTTHRAVPSILFLLSEQNIGQVSPQCSWDRQSQFTGPSLAIEDTLSGYMREEGFVIVTPAALLAQGIALGPEYAGPELSDEAAVRLAQRVGAEVVIVGKALARLSGIISGPEMKSIEATLSLHAVRADNGMIIASSSATGSAVHANEIVGGRQALTRAASDLVKDVSRQVAANWAQEASQAVVVELVIEGIKAYTDFVRFRGVLKNEIRGVNNVYLRAIKDGEARMDVDVKGSARKLADELMLKGFEGFGVNILEVGQNRIKLELIPKHGVVDES